MLPITGEFVAQIRNRPNNLYPRAATPWQRLARDRAAQLREAIEQSYTQVQFCELAVERVSHHPLSQAIFLSNQASRGSTMMKKRGRITTVSAITIRLWGNMSTQNPMSLEVGTNKLSYPVNKKIHQSFRIDSRRYGAISATPRPWLLARVEVRNNELNIDRQLRREFPFDDPSPSIYGADNEG